jgi:hypothetical protein
MESNVAERPTVRRVSWGARVPGDPNAAAGAADRWNLSFRSTREMRAKMEKAASISGRSLSAEAEHRLELSFKDNECLQSAVELALGPDLAAIAWEVIDALRWVANNRFMLLLVNEGQVRDPWVFNQMVEAAKHVVAAHPELHAGADHLIAALEKHRPEGPIVPPADVGFDPDLPSAATEHQRETAARIIDAGREAERNIGRTQAQLRIERSRKSAPVGRVVRADATLSGTTQVAATASTKKAKA